MPLGRINQQPMGRLFSSSEKKSKVKRCLFGTPDSNSIRKDLDEILQQDKMKAEHKWNFDIETESPLEGRYEWDSCEVADDDSIPDFYKRDVHRPVKKHFSRINGFNTKNSLSSSECSEENNVRLTTLHSNRSRDSPSNSGSEILYHRPSVNAALKQSRINGFFQQTKRKAGKAENPRSPKTIRY